MDASNPPVVRELRVTDIRCHARGCGAGPGQECRWPPSLMRAGTSHALRELEYDELVAAGYGWQEPSGIDLGEGREERIAARGRR